MMMNYCAIQRNGVVSSVDRKDTAGVVCPKPRRVGVFNCASGFNDVGVPSSRALRWHLGHQAELSDARAGSELLDIILTKGGHGAERTSMQIASSPPFFCGSPPSRVANPIIQDARFREEKQFAVPPYSPLPLSPAAVPTGTVSSPNSSSRKGGCNRASFGKNPAVRVEGFDCLDRDRRNCSIPTLA